MVTSISISPYQVAGDPKKGRSLEMLSGRREERQSFLNHDAVWKRDLEA